MLNKLFKLDENNTNVKTEVIAGLTTFMAMAYILAVNPNILSSTGMNRDAVLLATSIASFIGCMAMALLANYPFALAPGMGLNAYMAGTVCANMGYSWKVALLAVFAEGLVFIVLSLTNVREAIFNAIPSGLKKGVSAGIGLFIAFIGLQGAKIVVADSSTLLTYVRFTKDFHTVGIGALLALIGLFITVILYAKNVKGSILIGILSTWILGMLCQLVGIYVPNPDTGFYSLYPTFKMIDIQQSVILLDSASKLIFQRLRYLILSLFFSRSSLLIFLILSEHLSVFLQRQECLMKMKNFPELSQRSLRMPLQHQLVRFLEHQQLQHM